MATTSPNVTRDDVDAVCGFCVSLRSAFLHYRGLFEGPDLKKKLLDDTAPTFFGDLSGILIEHLILQICKITDPEGTPARRNLTVEFLVNNYDPAAPQNERDRLKTLNDSMQIFRAKILPARNKFIGHLDRTSVHNGINLGGAPVADWNEFWIYLQDFLQILHKRYIDPSGHFYLNAISGLSDADNLIKALKESAYFRTLLDDKKTTRVAADAAFNSKLFDIT